LKRSWKESEQMPGQVMTVVQENLVGRINFLY
jgi:hypothetical protein